MTNERHTEEARAYSAPAIASREKVDALAVDTGFSDSKPPICCA